MSAELNQRWRLQWMLACWMLLHVASVEAVTARLVPSNNRPLPGDQVTVQMLVIMDDTDALLGAYAAQLNWDASVVRLVSVQNGETAAFADPLVHATDGKLKISQFNAAGSSGTVHVADLVFDAVGKAGQSTGLDLRFDVLDAADTFVSLLSDLGFQTSTLTISAPQPATSPSVSGSVHLSSALPEVGGRLTVEVRLNVSSADRLGAYAGRLAWAPTMLQLVSISDGETAAFANGQVATESGAILFSNLNAQGESGAISLLNVAFHVVGTAGQTGTLALTFSSLDAAGTFENLLPYLSVQDGVFAISPGGVSGGQGADFDGNGAVDFVDFLFFAQRYGTRFGALDYVVAVDLSGDGVVDFSDFLIFARAFGRVSG